MNDDTMKLNYMSKMDSTPIHKYESLFDAQPIILNSNTSNYLINSHSDYLTYVIIFLIGSAALIWHFMPDRFRMIFSLKTESHYLRSVNANPLVQGNLITGFFAINYFISLGIFMLLFLSEFFEDLIDGYSIYEVLGWCYFVIGVFYIYRTALIYGISVIFNTSKLRKQQVRIGQNILFITGVFLLPIILLEVYTGFEILLIFAIVMIVLLQLIRLIKTFVIGKSISMFNALHIILYLCALDIVPVLVLIRMFVNIS
jgi:hypothetical protein